MIAESAVLNAVNRTQLINLWTNVELSSTFVEVSEMIGSLCIGVALYAYCTSKRLSSRWH